MWNVEMILCVPPDTSLHRVIHATCDVDSSGIGYHDTTATLEVPQSFLRKNCLTKIANAILQ